MFKQRARARNFSYSSFHLFFTDTLLFTTAKYFHTHFVDIFSVILIHFTATAKTFIKIIYTHYPKQFMLQWMQLNSDDFHLFRHLFIHHSWDWELQRIGRRHYFFRTIIHYLFKNVLVLIVKIIFCYAKGINER